MGGLTMKKSEIFLSTIALCSLVACTIYTTFNFINADKQAPTISCEQEMLETSVASFKNNPNLLLEGMKAKDNVDGDISDHILVEKIEKSGKTSNQFTITYVVYDQATNAKRYKRKLILSDYYPTQFYCGNALRFSQGSKVDLRNYISVIDAIDGDISSRIVYKAPSTLLTGEAKVGEYPCEATIVNSLKDEATISFQVEICGDSENESDYSPQITLSDYVVTCPKGKNFDPLNYLSGIREQGKVYQIDSGSLYYYEPMIEDYVEVNLNEMDVDPSFLVSEKEVDHVPGNWINAQFIHFTSDLDENTPGEYTGEYTYTSPFTGFTTSVVMHIVVEE